MTPHWLDVEVVAHFKHFPYGKVNQKRKLKSIIVAVSVANGVINMTNKEQETTTSSIRINPEIWSEFKVWCFRNRIAMSEKLEEMIREVIKKK